ncbi:TPA: nucleotidyltransferase family protein, partial [archaeon]|nr:nucleotidyltransferase family protein [Candidatus Naiadarchaeales archaeon SRR2090159.bin1288]
MQAIILAAGVGTRMLPLTSTKPKPMLPIATKPILEHIINATKKAGVKDIVIVQDKGKYIEKYFGSGEKLGVKIKYVVQEQKLGTGHAISICEPPIKSVKFLVVNGDKFVM